MTPVTLFWTHRLRGKTATAIGVLSLLYLIVGTTPFSLPNPAMGLVTEVAAQPADGLRIVDCLVPGKIRKRGRGQFYLSPSRPLKTTARDCRKKGGDSTSALKVWMPQAQAGNKMAQNNVGEIYEKGVGVPPDDQLAARWYQKAAEQGHNPARINLGHLYETGLGGAPNPDTALRLYRQASELKEAITMEPAPSVNQSRPTIQLIEPELQTRSKLTRIPTTSGAERLLVGKVIAPAGLLTFTVNNREQKLNTGGVFNVRIPVQQTSIPVQLVAIDQQGNRASTNLLLVPPEPQKVRGGGQAAPLLIPTDVNFGNYYALTIGNTIYDHWDDLETPENDALKVAELLQKKYGFTTQVLLNATRSKLLKTLDTFREKLTDQDNLLIYYAGHGHLEEKIKKGYWIPIDGDLDSLVEWISLATITDYLKVINAKHILIVADSCYAGMLTRSSLAQLKVGLSPQARQEWIKVLAQKRARIVLTSGDVQPVLDIGDRGHSVFAGAFLDVLRTNPTVLTGEQLHLQLAEQVTLAAQTLGIEQIPQYQPIRFADHASGDFLFVPVAQ